MRLRRMRSSNGAILAKFLLGLCHKYGMQTEFLTQLQQQLAELDQIKHPVLQQVRLRKIIGNCIQNKMPDSIIAALHAQLNELKQNYE